MQNNLFGEELTAPPRALRTNEPAGPPRFALFQTRLNRWTAQTQTFTDNDAEAANAWFAARGIALHWRPIADRKTYVIRR